MRRWLEEEYPAIEQRAAAENAEIRWGDETGVRSTCQVGRGYAPKGETPELKVAGGRFSVNMMSTITNQGKVRWMICTGSMNAALFIVFLQRLLRGAERKLFVIVDNLSVHESAAVEEWLVDKKDRIEVFYLPRCSPELNPDEYLNCDVKAGVNAHGLPKTRDELKDNLKRFMHKPAQLPKRSRQLLPSQMHQLCSCPQLRIAQQLSPLTVTRIRMYFDFQLTDFVAGLISVIVTNFGSRFRKCRARDVD